MNSVATKEGYVVTIKNCSVRDFCRGREVLCRNRKWKRHETNQDIYVMKKTLILQQTVQPATKSKDD